MTHNNNRNHRRWRDPYSEKKIYIIKISGFYFDNNTPPTSNVSAPPINRHFFITFSFDIRSLCLLSISSIVSPPEELVAAGSRTPSPKIKATDLVNRFVDENPSAVTVQVGDHVHLAYTHQKESPLWPRAFAVKDEIFCLFEGSLDNLGSLNQQYGLGKSSNEVILVIEAYKALRDRAPYPPSQVVSHLDGNFAFIVFDKSTSNLFVATDPIGKVGLCWGITSDGQVAFGNDIELLKGACGKSLASFPQGCFYSTAHGQLRCYENPKNKITAVPATEEEIWGAKFMVEGPTVLAAMK